MEINIIYTLIKECLSMTKNVFFLALIFMKNWILLSLSIYFILYFYTKHKNNINKIKKCVFIWFITMLSEIALTYLERTIIISQLIKDFNLVLYYLVLIAFTCFVINCINNIIPQLHGKIVKRLIKLKTKSKMNFKKLSEINKQ